MKWRLSIFVLAMFPCLDGNCVLKIRPSVAVASEGISTLTHVEFPAIPGESTSETQLYLEELRTPTEDRSQYYATGSGGRGSVGRTKTRSTSSIIKQRELRGGTAKQLLWWTAPLTAVVVILVVAALKRRCSAYFRSLASRPVGQHLRRLAASAPDWVAACTALPDPTTDACIEELLLDDAYDGDTVARSVRLEIIDEDIQHTSAEQRVAKLAQRPRFERKRSRRSCTGHATAVAIVVAVLMIFLRTLLQAFSNRQNTLVENVVNSTVSGEL